MTFADVARKLKVSYEAMRSFLRRNPTLHQLGGEVGGTRVLGPRDVQKIVTAYRKRKKG